MGCPVVNLERHLRELPVGMRRELLQVLAYSEEDGPG